MSKIVLLAVLVFSFFIISGCEEEWENHDYDHHRHSQYRDKGDYRHGDWDRDREWERKHRQWHEEHREGERW